jgi:hypothetical protein
MQRKFAFGGLDNLNWLETECQADALLREIHSSLDCG